MLLYLDLVKARADPDVMAHSREQSKGTSACDCYTSETDFMQVSIIILHPSPAKHCGATAWPH